MSFGAAVDLYYKKTRSGCPVHGYTLDGGDDVDTPQFGLNKKAFKSVLKQIETNPEQLINPQLFTYTYKMLNKAVDQTFGNIQVTDPNYLKVLKMRKSLAVFSAYKSAHQTYELKGALKHTNPEGKAQSINAKYNNDWLRTEYVHTVRATRHADNFWQYQKDKDLYPYLEYTPSRSAEPRNEHKKLYGIVKPVDDPFWDTWLPPNDWGCKCGVKQVREPGKAKEVPKIKQPPAVMRHNPAKTGKIFTEQHPMIKRLKKESKWKINDELETIKDKLPYILAYKNKKNKIYIHPFADDTIKEIKGNILAGKLIVDKLNLTVHIRPHINIKGVKNAEYLINNMVADRKTPMKKTFKNVLKAADIQGCKIVVIELKLIKKYSTIKDAKKILLKRLADKDHYSNIKEVILISKDEKEVVKFKRKKATRK